MSSLVCQAVSNRCTGLPASSPTAWNFEFRPPFVRPIQRGTAPFQETRCRSVGLQMGGVDHETVSGPGLSGQLAEDLVKDPHSAPSYKPIVECLVRAIGLRRVFPLQTMSDSIDNSADHSQIIHARDAVWHWEIGRDPVQLLPAQLKHVTHDHLQP